MAYQAADSAPDQAADKAADLAAALAADSAADSAPDQAADLAEDKTADKAADWDDATFFWVGSYPAAGDTVSWSFAEPLAAQSAAVLTGERGGTKDQAVGALLEYSVNGSEWVKLADFTYGHAEAALPAVFL